MSEILEVRQAAAGDLAVILGMIDEAAGWLRTKGTDQWNEPWPSRKARDNRVLRGLRSGRTWLVESGGSAVATITYRQHGNQELWTEAELGEPAVYVSRLIVSRKYSGLDIGGALTDWAGLRAARGWSAQWIRIDVWTTNEALHNYYAKRGFGFYRICPFDKEAYPSAALFQKPTSEVDSAAAARFTESPGWLRGSASMAAAPSEPVAACV
jgi:ribosomal protein S18 acetylase RimI-like enzyme